MRPATPLRRDVIEVSRKSPRPYDDRPAAARRVQDSAPLPATMMTAALMRTAVGAFARSLARWAVLAQCRDVLATPGGLTSTVAGLSARRYEQAEAWAILERAMETLERYVAERYGCATCYGWTCSTWTSPAMLRASCEIGVAVEPVAAACTDGR